MGIVHYIGYIFTLDEIDRTTDTQSSSSLCLSLCLFPPHLTLPCIALHCLALPCIALHCIALPCIALHRLALHCTALHCLA